MPWDRFPGGHGVGVGGRRRGSRGAAGWWSWVLLAGMTLAARGAFPLRLDATGRHLEDAAGKPFLLLGDSPWSLIVEPSLEQAERYLDDRRLKGFSAVLVNLIERKFSSHPPALRDGTPPFARAGDFGTPNPAYFDHAEAVVRKAAERGIVVLLSPAYLGWNGGDQGFYQEMARNGPSKIRSYGRFVGRRFREHPNVVWVVGGDFNPPPERRWTVLEVAAGIRDEDPGHFMTVHCAPGGAAADLYGDRAWLELDNVYDYREDLYTECLRLDARRPRRPFFLIETAYEGEHQSSPARIRRQAWWPLACGAFGLVYGNAPVWHFGSVGTQDRGGDWVAALDSTGARDMARLAAFLRSRSWWRLRPDREHRLVTGGWGTPGKGDYVAAAVADDRSWALAYVPATGQGPRELQVDLSALSGPVSAQWFNPAATATGVQAVEHGPLARTGSQAWRTPGDNGTGTNDWVLVLEGPAAGR